MIIYIIYVIIIMVDSFRDDKFSRKSFSACYRREIVVTEISLPQWAISPKKQFEGVRFLLIRHSKYS